jgi:tRNA U55 pseudouridine synthase TruB
VRSFPKTLGQLVGAGACLETLRRTASGEFRIDDAVTLTTLQAAESPERLLMPLERVLLSMPGVRVTEEGAVRVAHGRAIDSRHFFAEGASGVAMRDQRADRWVRVLDPGGRLIAVARADVPADALHPSVVMI